MIMAIALALAVQDAGAPVDCAQMGGRSQQLGKDVGRLVEDIEAAKRTGRASDAMYADLATAVERRNSFENLYARSCSEARKPPQAPQLVESAAAQEPVEGEEIVVRAQFGNTTMLFDRGVDGKLRNCRIMVSSGSQRRDTNACQATPVCYAKTADEVTDCRELTFLELSGGAVPGDLRPTNPSTPQTFVLPKLSDPKPSLAQGQAGPIGPQEPSRETERQRVKLPPLPKAPSDGPIIRVGPAKELGE